jgi:hypothetical protein
MRVSVFVGALLFACLVSGEAAAQESDSAKIVEARAIVAAVMPPEQRDQMVQQLMQEFSGQIAAAIDFGKVGDPGLVSLLDDYRKDLLASMMPTVHANLPKIADAMAIAYTHEFSIAELKDIHAFATTPAGKHYLSRSTALVGDPAVAAANTAYLRELQQIAAPKAEEFKTKVLAYFEAHPDVAKKVAATVKSP